MSVFKRAGRKVFSYDFHIQGNRFSGTTGKTSKRDAEDFEKAERKRVEAETAREGEPLTMAVACSKYWEEVGQLHVRLEGTWAAMGWLVEHFGKNRLLSSITDADVAKAVIKRRSEGVSPATINRTMTQRLRAVMTRAADTWGAAPAKIKWGTHILKEPEERVREMQADEEAKLFAVLRPDYHPIVRFALLTGCRMQECLDLTWRQIDTRNHQMRVLGKGSKTRTVPITKNVGALLKAEKAVAGVIPAPDARVFTYVVKRADHAERGTRLPIEYEGLKITFKRATTKAQITDLHFHDLRHTCATRLLRATGNLRLVKDLLGHEDMKTTLKYAHVTTDDLRAAMNATENATEATVAPDKPLIYNEDAE